MEGLPAETDPVVLKNQLEALKRELLKKERKLRRLSKKKALAKNNYDYISGDRKENVKKSIETHVQGQPCSYSPNSDVYTHHAYDFSGINDHMKKRKHEGSDVLLNSFYNSVCRIPNINHDYTRNSPGLQGTPAAFAITSKDAEKEALFHHRCIDGSETFISSLGNHTNFTLVFDKLAQFEPITLPPRFFLGLIQGGTLCLAKTFLSHQKSCLAMNMLNTLQEIHFDKNFYDDIIYRPLFDNACLNSSILRLLPSERVGTVFHDTHHYTSIKHRSICQNQVPPNQNSQNVVDSSRILLETSSSASSVSSLTDCSYFLRKRKQEIKLDFPKKRKFRDSMLINSVFGTLLKATVQQPVHDFVLPDNEYINLKLEVVKRKPAIVKPAWPKTTKAVTKYDENATDSMKLTGNIPSQKDFIMPTEAGEKRNEVSAEEFSINQENTGNKLEEIPITHIRCSVNEPVRSVHLWKCKRFSLVNEIVILVCFESALYAWMKNSEGTWIEKLLYTPLHGSRINSPWLCVNSVVEDLDIIICLVSECRISGFVLTAVFCNVLTGEATSIVALSTPEVSNLKIIELCPGSFATASKFGMQSTIIKLGVYQDNKRWVSKVKVFGKLEGDICSVVKINSLKSHCMLVMTPSSMHIWDYINLQPLKIIKTALSNGDWVWASVSLGIIIIFGKPEKQKMTEKNYQLLAINPLTGLCKVLSELDISENSTELWPNICNHCAEKLCVIGVQSGDSTKFLDVCSKKIFTEFHMDTTASALCNCECLVVCFGTRYGCMYLRC